MTDAAHLDVDAAFRAYAPYVAAVGARLLGRVDELEDVVQEVFLDAVSGLRTLREPAAIKGWLATVTVRIARRRLKRRRLRAFLGLDDVPDYHALVAPSVDPEQRLLVARIYTVLDGLPVDQRLAWSLRYLESEPLAVVAEACGCSLATAKRRIAAAHAALTEALDHG